MYIVDHNPNWAIFGYENKNDFKWGHSGHYVIFRIFNLFTAELDQISTLVCPDGYAVSYDDILPFRQINGDFLYYKSSYSFTERGHILHVVKLDSPVDTKKYPATTFWPSPNRRRNKEQGVNRADEHILTETFFQEKLMDALIIYNNDNKTGKHCCLTVDYGSSSSNAKLKNDAIKLNVDSYAFDTRFKNRTVPVNHQGKKIIFNTDVQTSTIFTNYLLKYSEKIVLGMRYSANEFEEFIIVGLGSVQGSTKPSEKT